MCLGFCGLNAVRHQDSIESMCTLSLHIHWLSRAMERRSRLRPLEMAAWVWAALRQLCGRAGAKGDIMMPKMTVILRLEALPPLEVKVSIPMNTCLSHIAWSFIGKAQNFNTDVDAQLNALWLEDIKPPVCRQL